MRKRFLSILLAVVMLCVMLPQVSIEADAAEYTVVMTAYEFIDYLKIALSRKTAYSNQYPGNVGYYNGNTISWDCWNLGKTIIWTKGSIVNNYTTGTWAAADFSCGLKDWDGYTIVKKAPNCSGDFSNLVPGEWLYMEGHTGYYIGDGQVIECTINWGLNGVMVSQIDSNGTRSRNGVESGKWLLHGMVPWLDYEASPVVKKTYPSYCIAEVTANDTLIKSLPCNAKLDANSIDVERVSKETQYLATALVQNTVGELWYEVTAKNGKAGYLYAGDAVYRAQRTDDLKATGVTAPTLHTKGYVYYLNGTVSATYNQLTEVSAYVYAGSGTQGTKETGAAVSVSGNTFSLKNSQIDAKTAFGTLAVGTHTYVVSASYKNYYAKSATSIGENTGTVALFDATFVVVKSASSCTHAYSSKVATAATCVANGKRTYTCSKCSTSYSETIPATGVHNYTGAITTAATCIGNGTMTYTCKACPSRYKEVIPAIGHSYKTKVTAPTCTGAGYTTYTCACGNSYVADETAALGHSYKTVTVDATCTANGSITDTCSACGDSQVQTVPSAGHTYSDWTATIPVGCTVNGTNTRKCLRCDHTQTEMVMALGHDYQDGVCTGCGASDPDYSSLSVTITSFGSSSDHVTVCIYPKDTDTALRTLTVKGGSVTITGLGNGEYRISFSKKNHATREYGVSLTGGEAVLDAKIHLIGDVTGDGKVNVGDVAKIYSHIRKTVLFTDEYQLLCANVNGGSLNVGDVANIYSHIKGIKKLY